MFLARAPKNIVDAEKSKLEAAMEKLDKLRLRIDVLKKT
ncbi:hypothetical protein HYV58_01780 [Candidatus Peregrinibacteria bacterium]|nr:hypothetical protein [Candidatus Peregrinibacteria bacterium]